MPVEIERKFLVQNDNWKNNVVSECQYRQGYISCEKYRTVRVRTACNRGFITIKGMRNGLTRPEYEYEIPFNDAVEMMELFCLKPVIEKVRYKVLHNNNYWEIDVFDKENQGLITAEIEMENETVEIDLPEWIGLDVTDDSRYSNSNLVKNPYVNWGVKAKVI